MTCVIQVKMPTARGSHGSAPATPGSFHPIISLQTIDSSVYFRLLHLPGHTHARPRTVQYCPVQGNTENMYTRLVLENISAKICLRKHSAWLCSEQPCTFIHDGISVLSNPSIFPHHKISSTIYICHQMMH